MTQALVRPGVADDKLAEPAAQVHWLEQGQLPQASPLSPASLHRVPNAGWYADRLRYWNGRDWTSEVRSIRRPSPVMRFAFEDDGRAEPGAAVRLIEPAPTGPMEVGLLGLPPSLPSKTVASRAAVSELKRGLISGLRGSLVVVGAAMVAVTLVVAIGIVFNL
jgi:hypothetical protein